MTRATAGLPAVAGGNRFMSSARANGLLEMARLSKRDDCSKGFGGEEHIRGELAYGGHALLGKASSGTRVHLC